MLVKCNRYAESYVDARDVTETEQAKWTEWDRPNVMDYEPRYAVYSPSKYCTLLSVVYLATQKSEKSSYLPDGFVLPLAAGNTINEGSPSPAC